MKFNVWLKRKIEKTFDIKKFSWEKWFQEYETEIVALFGLVGFFLSGEMAYGFILFAFIPIVIHMFWNLIHYKQKYLSKLWFVDKPAKKFGDRVEKVGTTLGKGIDKYSGSFGDWIDRMLKEKK